MLRVIFGLLKGAVVGGAGAYGAWRLGWMNGAMAYVWCALVAAVVGVVAGQPPWRAETIWTPVLKMLVGAAVGAGLCWVGFALLPNPGFHLAGVEMELHSAPLLAPLIGILYGIFVEVDDGGEKKSAEPAPPAKR